MKLRICRYSISTVTVSLRLISLLLLFCIGLPAAGQQPSQKPTPQKSQKQKKKEEAAKVDTIPLYNGTYVGVDLYGIGSKVLGGDFLSSEISVGVNLKNRFIQPSNSVWAEQILGTKQEYIIKVKWLPSSESV